jgi:TusA-related sulfurtransferase
MAIAFDRELDVRGAKCPVPVVKARQSVNELQVGQVLRVLATDPGSVNDFQGLGTNGEKYRANCSGESHHRRANGLRPLYSSHGMKSTGQPVRCRLSQPVQGDSKIKLV